TTLQAGNAFPVDRLDDLQDIPSFAQPRRIDLRVQLVITVKAVGGWLRHADAGHAAQAADQCGGIAAPRRDPAIELRQLHPADRRLHLRHPEITAEALVLPAETRRVLALEHGLPTLAVVLVGPGA